MKTGLTLVQSGAIQRLPPCLQLIFRLQHKHNHRPTKEQWLPKVPLYLLDAFDVTNQQVKFAVAAAMLLGLATRSQETLTIATLNANLPTGLPTKVLVSVSEPEKHFIALVASSNRSSTSTERRCLKDLLLGSR
jgi:hypothetical protein